MKKTSRNHPELMCDIRLPQPRTSWCRLIFLSPPNSPVSWACRTRAPAHMSGHARLHEVLHACALAPGRSPSPPYNSCSHVHAYKIYNPSFFLSLSEPFLCSSRCLRLRRGQGWPSAPVAAWLTSTCRLNCSFFVRMCRPTETGEFFWRKQLTFWTIWG